MTHSYDYDVFISHASEDKDTFVRPLAEELSQREFRVWYDEFTLTVGDSLRRNIDYGLSSSRYGIVVLSPSFFEKEWPQKELDGLTAREVDGQKVILPVWHNVSKADVLRYSPMLADRVSVPTSMGMNYVVAELLKVIRPLNTEKKEPKTQKPIGLELPVIEEESTVFFSQRMAKAFPGINGLYWFASPVEAADRLSILLQPPLEFQHPERLRYMPARESHIRTDPVWWWRGYGNMQITRFQNLGNGKCLMDYQELDIAKIAAYRNHSYYREFVYVETKAELPTGIYEHEHEDILKRAAAFGYAAEEYGVLGETLISRAEYDDGAAAVNGKVIDAAGAKLRMRYLTPYNFLIAASDSPINNHDVDLIINEFLDGILQGRRTLEEFVETAASFKRRDVY